MVSAFLRRSFNTPQAFLEGFHTFSTLLKRFLTALRARFPGCLDVLVNRHFLGIFVEAANLFLLILRIGDATVQLKNHQMIFPLRSLNHVPLHQSQTGATVPLRPGTVTLRFPQARAGPLNSPKAPTVQYLSL